MQEARLVRISRPQTTYMGWRERRGGKGVLTLFR